MGLSNGPATSASTACVSAAQVGAASGVSNMARYVGAAVATALAATIYGNVIASKTAEGQRASTPCPPDSPAASWVMAVFSLAGVVMAVVMGRHQGRPGHSGGLGRSGGRPHAHPADLGHAHISCEDTMTPRRHVARDRSLTGLMVPGLALMLALAACGDGGDGGDGDGSTALKAAEAKVSAKEQALEDAKADFEEKSAQFCDASQTYVVALDRYGDVVHETAVTVGDVRLRAATSSNHRKMPWRAPRRPLRRSNPSLTRSRSLPRPRRLSPS